VLRRDRRTWVHTVREEFATYYPLADLMRWLGGDPIGRHAIVNLRAIERVTHYVAVFTAYGCVTAEALKSPLRELVRPGLASVLKTHH
jgi:hypothetical protein